MKKLILILTLILITYSSTFSQNSPTLKLTGASPSLSKGNIDTEVLSAIIQQKQEEIKQRVFRNTIIKQFKDPQNTYSKKLNNFTTFNYLYNVMDVLSSGKNKSVMTKSLIESSSEFAFIFGLALYHNDQVVQDSKVNYTIRGKIEIPEQKVEEFNLLIDLCLVVVMENEDKFQELFKFNNSLKNIAFQRWYDSDNVFILEMEQAKKNNDTNRIQYLNNKKVALEKDIAFILNLSSQTTKIIDSLELTDDSNLKKVVGNLKVKLSLLSGEEIVNELANIKTNYSYKLSDEQKQNIDNISNIIDDNFDNFKNLYNFYIGIKKSNFKDFSLTSTQYYSLKYILTEFIDVAKNQYPNDAISSVLDFLLENTLVEYNDNSGNIVTDDYKDIELGYLYVDIESVIFAIDSRFNDITKKSFGKYITPFFSIGTNYASFNETNDLITNSDGTTSSLSNLYFASEKIGVKWKLWNWEYTHGFEAGEIIKYYGKKNYWKRPQQVPLISNLHILAYGSGLLYNLVDLKSEEDFNSAIVGVGVGITFFNGLSTSLSVASPITEKNISSKNSFVNFGIDIPIIEYIGELSKK
ncbi:hypothetical protein [uncultured Draconibacterium sp.]|uniref:hypothetical protein n=1 Tax=uncultured Draconibacterium sp. TaxID=1573823 RepID=UPI0029C70B83|nr:hypothetical protein [uncultured Draconibacterium sp.]